MDPIEAAQRHRPPHPSRPAPVPFEAAEDAAAGEPAGALAWLSAAPTHPEEMKAAGEMRLGRWVRL